MDDGRVRKAHSRSKSLLQHHRTGTFELPSEILLSAEALERSSRWLADARIKIGQAREHVAEVTQELVASVADAATADAKPPSVAPIEKARAALTRAELEASVVLQGRDQCVLRFQSATETAAEDTIVLGLRPALNALIDEVRPFAAQIEGISNKNEVDTPAQFAAWQRLAELAESYETLRMMWRQFVEIGDLGSSTDEGGFFSELRDSDVHQSRVPGTPSKLPSEPPARLAYIALRANPWLPLGSERDHEWRKLLERSGEAERRRRHKESSERWGSFV